MRFQHGANFVSGTEIKALSGEAVTPIPFKVA